MRQLQRLAVMLAILGLAACHPPNLAKRFVVNDQTWNPGAPYQVKLAPGDVLFLTTWIHGIEAKPGPLQSVNAYPPDVGTVRLPLRHADGPLHAMEAALLGAVLATHVVAGPVDVAALGRALEQQQVRLWNALIASLKLAKLPGSAPLQLQVDDGAFCHAFAGATPTAEQTLILQTYFRAHTAAAGACRSAGSSDLRNIRQLGTALAPLTEIHSNMTGGFYLPKNIFVAVTRVEAELGGASMRTQAGIEARWSLAEWEAAKICKDASGAALPITYVTLGQDHVRSLQVLPPLGAGGPPKGEIEVVVDPVQGRAVKQDEDLRGKGTISHASLRLLFPADLVRLTWGQRHSSLDAALRPACTLD